MRTMYGRRRRRQRLYRLFLLFFALFCLAVGLFLGLRYDGGTVSFQRNIPFSYYLRSQFLFAGELGDLKGLYGYLPVYSDVEGDVKDSLLAWDVAYDTDEISGDTIPVFVSSSAEGGQVADLVQREKPGNLDLVAVDSGSPQVLIYCTHTAESYADDPKGADGRGSVLKVAHRLQETLKNSYGIEAVVSDNVNDSPDWSRSYMTSKLTAQELLGQYPDASLIIDLHRDSGPAKAESTVKVDGKSAATLLLVVGSDATMNHPNWRQNWDTAKSVAASVEAVNKNILAGVRVQKGRYNQHLTPKSVLLEVGTDKNTLEEALNSADVFAAAVNKYFGN